MLDRFFKYSSRLGEKAKERFSDFLSAKTPQEQYLCLIALWDDKDFKQGITLNSTKNISTFFAPYFSNNNPLLNQLLHLETSTSLPENLLMKVDKMTMAFGVEARVPFLAKDVVNFANSLPTSLKLKGFQEKYILRQAVKNIIPSTSVSAKKQQFFVPIDHWLSKDLKQYAEHLFEKQEAKQFFKVPYLQKILEDKSSQLYRARQLWNVVNFLEWHEQFIEKKK